MFAAEDCALVAFQMSGSMSSDTRNWTIQGGLRCATSNVVLHKNDSKSVCSVRLRCSLVQTQLRSQPLKRST
jgi:hypothetical protein